MTTTIAIDANGQLTLPKKLRDRAGLRPGARVRVSNVQEGLLLSPVEEAERETWEEELRAIERATGYPRSPEPRNAIKRIKAAIREVRHRK
jgi:AbrB family looped-hinge helix DNA binding protein